MSKENTSLGDWNKKGWVEIDGKLVKSDSLVAKKIEKIMPNLKFENPAQLLKYIEVVELEKSNKKIRNATKATNEHGVKFDSLLEKYLYDLLISAKIHFEFQKQYLLQDKFRYRNEAVRAITLTADFYLPTHGIIADSKGLQTQQGAIRWKMLKSVLKHIYDYQPEIVILKNKKECDAFVNKLRYNA